MAWREPTSGLTPFPDRTCTPVIVARRRTGRCVVAEPPFARSERPWTDRVPMDVTHDAHRRRRTRAAARGAPGIPGAWGLQSSTYRGRLVAFVDMAPLDRLSYA